MVYIVCSKVSFASSIVSVDFNQLVLKSRSHVIVFFTCPVIVSCHFGFQSNTLNSGCALSGRIEACCTQAFRMSRGVAVLLQPPQQSTPSDLLSQSASPKRTSLISHLEIETRFPAASGALHFHLSSFPQPPLLVVELLFQFMAQIISPETLWVH